ncbi:hypothetical protein [Crocinitomix catalasitica]|uniref:hypothetical protein n=1 Tax=Crocinitomix catalasitica TaxID=184607 RepID=UPI0004866B03|nr:hypothetical protein [Crocinitomix catalasitica]
MKYETWLTYTNMSMAVQCIKGEYHCSEFGANQERKLNLKICTSTLELKFFLLSLPKPPKKDILALINRIENNLSGEVV